MWSLIDKKSAILLPQLIVIIYSLCSVISIFQVSSAKLNKISLNTVILNYEEPSKVAFYAQAFA